MAQAVPKENPPRHKKRFMRRNTEQNISGYLMVMPNLVGFCVFTVFGILFSLALAFTDWDMLKGFENANFVGLKNFTDMFQDTYLVNSLINNAILLLTVPITLGLAMVLASVFNRGIYGKSGRPRPVFPALCYQHSGHFHGMAGAVPPLQRPHQYASHGIGRVQRWTARMAEQQRLGTPRQLS